VEIHRQQLFSTADKLLPVLLILQQKTFLIQKSFILQSATKLLIDVNDSMYCTWYRIVHMRPVYTHQSLKLVHLGRVDFIQGVFVYMTEGSKRFRLSAQLLLESRQIQSRLNVTRGQFDDTAKGSHGRIDRFESLKSFGITKPNCRLPTAFVY